MMIADHYNCIGLESVSTLKTGLRGSSFTLFPSFLKLTRILAPPLVLLAYAFYVGSSAHRCLHRLFVYHILR